MTAWTRETTADPPHRELVAAVGDTGASAFMAATTPVPTSETMKMCPVGDLAEFGAPDQLVCVPPVSPFQQAHWTAMERCAESACVSLAVMMGVAVVWLFTRGTKR